MSIGISKTKAASIIRSAGGSDEIAAAVAKAIQQNNDQVQRDVQNMIDDAIRSLKK